MRQRTVAHGFLCAAQVEVAESGHFCPLPCATLCFLICLHPMLRSVTRHLCLAPSGSLSCACLWSVLVSVAGFWRLHCVCQFPIAVYAGTHEPQPVPQDADRTLEGTPTTAPSMSEHAPQPPPTADSPRPSQPPADDMLSDDQALHPPSGPPSRPPSIPPAQPPKGVAKDAHSQGVSQVQQRHSPHHRSAEDVGGRRQLLREHVVHVTEAAAGLPGLISSEEECKKVHIAKLQNCQFPFQTPASPPPFLRIPLNPPFQHTWNLLCIHVQQLCEQDGNKVPIAKLQGDCFPPPRSVLPLASSFLLCQTIIPACTESCMHICTAAVVVCAQL